MSIYGYDCYDVNKNHIGIIKAKGWSDLLEKVPNAEWALGTDYVTRKPNWHSVKVNARMEKVDWDAVFKKLSEDLKNENNR